MHVTPLSAKGCELWPVVCYVTTCTPVAKSVTWLVTFHFVQFWLFIHSTKVTLFLSSDLPPISPSFTIPICLISAPIIPSKGRATPRCPEQPKLQTLWFRCGSKFPSKFWSELYRSYPRCWTLSAVQVQLPGVSAPWKAPVKFQLLHMLQKFNAMAVVGKSHFSFPQNASSWKKKLCRECATCLRPFSRGMSYPHAFFHSFYFYTISFGVGHRGCVNVGGGGFKRPAW